MKNLMIVNNTTADIRPLHAALVAFAKGGELDEAIADIFVVKIIVENGITKLIITWA